MDFNVRPAPLFYAGLNPDHPWIFYLNKSRLSMTKLSVIVVALVVAGLPLAAGAHHLPSHTDSKADTGPTARQKIDAAYQQQSKKIKAAYRQYQKKVAKVWGSAAEMPDAKRDVTYRNHLTQRSIIDYEQGEVRVELAVKPAQAKNRAQLKNELATAVGDTLLQQQDNRSIEEIAANPEPVADHGPPLLQGLVAAASGSAFSAAELEDFKVAKSQAMEMREITGDDGKHRVLVSTRFRMVPEHIRVLAQRFQSSVDHYSQLQEIPAALTYAIIETESAFNPRAKSPVPAFGLMQLVPELAARDAFRFLHSKDRIVKERYLYVPDKNIELGTAYLHILYHRYFKDIKDPLSRQWATIAAYNAGPRNVIKAVTGEYTKRKYASSYFWKRHAFKKINKMDARQLFHYLLKRMPAGETRRYLKKVRGRMSKYDS
jgi:membrane-bound lytic murein transglycosylase C